MPTGIGPERRDRRATDAAYQKGRDDAVIAGRFDRLEEHAKLVNGSIERTASRLTSLGLQLTHLEAKQDTRDAIAAAFQKAAASAFTARQLYIALGGFLVAATGMVLGLR